MKTLLVMAGGTGGHVMPALAVARDLSARGVNIVWMGTAHGSEHELVPAAGCELRYVHIRGIRRSGLGRKLMAPFVLIGAALQAAWIIMSCRANAILGMGGYVSGPGGLVGRLMLKPLILHEQNAVVGTTNSLLAPVATRVLTGFKQVEKLSGGEYVGNPVRSDIVAVQAPAQRIRRDAKHLKILVVGGSQGAQVFNENLPRLLQILQERLGDAVRVSVHHQCGRNNHAEVSQRYAQSGLEVRVEEFIRDMARAYQDSELVICRAGAMTVAEVAAAGAAALFVPLPHAIDDHQYYNARALSDHQAAMCFRQEEFVSGQWLDTVAGLAVDRDALITMAERARSASQPDATRRVADICMEVLDA